MSQKSKSLCMGCMMPLDSGTKPCPHCNWEPDSVWDLQYLKPGTVLSNRYIVGVSVRKNGESVMYVGYDNSLQTRVWIHEYYPLTLAQREVETGSVSPLPGCGAQYKALMSDFVDVCNEVKRLGITEPVVPIENVLSENNTVYAVYKGLDLVSLEEYLQSIGAPLPYPVAVSLLAPICNTLGTIHTHGHIHRGVSPYSVYVDPDGSPYLWDFALGATRTAGSELDCELYTGYSAPEQYSPSGWQGSWTDVYAMGALFYRTLTGIVPPKSIRIDNNHPLTPIDDLVMGLPKNVSTAIMDAMAISTDDRTQAMPTFVSGLLQEGKDSTAVYDTSKVARAGGRWDSDEMPPPVPVRRGGAAKFVVLGLVFTVLLLVGMIWVFMTRYYPELMPSNQNPQSETSESESSAAEIVAGENSVEVPQFIGRMLTTVMSDSTYEDRFEFDVYEDYSDDHAEGEIYEQFPSAGTPMPEKGTVILYVSKGGKQVAMPILEGYTLEQAADILGNIDVEFRISDQYAADAEPGTVVSTYPEAGVEFDPKRQTVMLFVMPEVSIVEGQQSEPEEPEPSQPEPSQPDPDDENYFPPLIIPKVP